MQTFIDAFSDIDGPILDLGCGTGRLLVEFLKARRDMVGCDAANDMIEWAEKVLAEADVACPLYVQAAHQLDIDQSFAGVYMCGAFGLGGSRQQDLESLRRVHGHLREGGRFVMDHYLPNLESPKGWEAWITKPELPRSWPKHVERKVARDGSEFELRTRQHDFDPLRQTTTLEIEVTKSRDGEEIGQERGLIDIGLYFLSELELMLASAGFSDVQVTSFGEPTAPEPWVDRRILIQAVA